MFYFRKNSSNQESSLKWYQRFNISDVPAIESAINRIQDLRFEQKILCGNAIALFVCGSGILVGVKVGEYPLNQANQLRVSLQKEHRLLSELRNHSLSFEELIEFPPNPRTPQSYIKTRSQLMQGIARTRHLAKILSQNTQLSASPKLILWRSQYQNQQNQFLLNLEKILTTHKDSNKISKLNQQLQRIEQGQITANRQWINQLSAVIEIIEQKDKDAEAAFNQAQIIQMIIIICFIGLSLVMTYYVSLLWSRKLVNPITYTTNKAQHAIHQINGDVIDTSTNEVNNLTNALNVLLEQANLLKQQKQAAEKQIEVAVSTKNRFLANISHELRTPLNGILGYAQIMMRSPDLSSEHQRGISTIYNCGSHLLDLINDILDFSKLETDKTELNSVDFHFPSFCQGIVESCRIQAEQKGLKFIYSPAFNLPIGINTDKSRLRQVMTNLIKYAIKSTNKGYVKLKIQAFPYPQNPEKQVISIKISKTDDGMSDEQIKSLLTPFENVYNHEPQADEPGFAITLSQKILKRMGSQLKINSKKLAGTAFSFALVSTIPNDWTENSTISGKGKIIGYVGEQKKILIVDDSWENRAILTSLLEPLKFAILEASNGQEGLNQVEQFQPDLIISDIGMPVMDGWELLSQIRQISNYAQPKFILCSASTSEYEQQVSTNKGVDSFLSKPIEAEELYQILSNQLDLTWTYTSNAIDDTCLDVKGEIIIPPFTVIASLLEFAKRGQIRGIQDELDKIDILDHRYTNFVKKLRYYTKTFNIQKIRDFLHKNVRK